jgi:hypothetical protein
MSKRNSGLERKRRDNYPTPVGPLDALLSAVEIPRCLVWEPAAGRRRMLAKQLVERGYDVIDTDIAQGAAYDFFAFARLPRRSVGAIITNPPFGRDGARFVRHALSLLPNMAPPQLACFLFPTDYDHAVTRQDIFGNGVFLGEVKLTKRIVWFARKDGTAAPSEWHSWFLFRPRLVPGDPFVRFASW